MKGPLKVSGREKMQSNLSWDSEVRGWSELKKET